LRARQWEAETITTKNILMILVLAPLGFQIGKKAAEILSGNPAEDPLAADKR
jgi:hypothetical protein